MRSSISRVFFSVILFVIAGLSVKAQQFPVTASTQIIPPYSVYLPDYAVPGSDKLRVILVQNDLTQPSYDVILQMTVEQNGTLIMRTSGAFHPRALTLTAGVPTIISGADLSDYLNTNNIDFSGGFSRDNYDRTKALPEGAYRISFTAFDYRRPTVQVSNTGANIFFFQKSEPPLLNLPICGSRVDKIDPQFLTFNWSNRNTPNPLPGSGTEYIFSLYEIKPKNSNADYIVRSARPLYTVTTESNTLIYGPGEPQLIDSMEYVWIVQARDKSGRDMFSNQGYSQSCKFTYLGTNPFQVNNINKPLLYGVSNGERSIKLWWPRASSNRYSVETYRLQYRAAAKDGVEYDWFTQETQTDSALTLHSLEPNRRYEARLQWRISGVYGPYSELVTVTTDSLRVFSCGDGSKLQLPANSQPLPSAIAGNIVRIGLFDVMLTEVTGGNGVFSGTGRVITPGFGMGLPMYFNSISINTDLVVIRGEMQAVTSGIDKFVSDELKNQHGGDDVGQVKTGDIVPDITTNLHIFTKENITVDTLSGTIILTDGKGGKEVVNYTETGKTLPLVIEDADGHLFNIDKNGTVTDAGIRDKSINTTTLNNLDLSKGRITFSAAANNKYAFDAWKEAYTGKAVLDSSYELLANGQYRVSAKAIIPGAHEDVIATLEGSSDTSTIKFVSGMGIVYPSTKTGNQYTVTITGGPASDAQEVFAVYPKAGGGYTSIGKLLVASYAPIQQKVVLIPVGQNTSVPETAIKSSLEKAYGRIGISYTVETDNTFRDNTSWDLDGDEVLQDSKSAFLSNGFTGEEKAMKKAYAKTHDIDDEVTYLFVVNEAAMSGSDLLGKMPRQSQFGFIFVKGASTDEISRTVAHETGHGAYTLEHTFSSGIGLSQGSTDNLMDYNNGYTLLKYQWDIVHDPGHVWGVFEGDGESNMERGKSLYKCLNGIPADVWNGKHIFYAPDGNVIKLPDNAVPASVYYKDLSTSNSAKKGSLASFIYNGKEYDAFYYPSTGAFAGYSYDSKTYYNSSKLNSGEVVTEIGVSDDDVRCEVTIDGVTHPNPGCLCQNKIYKRNYDLFTKIVVGSDQPAVKEEIYSICQTLSELPSDVLETNNQLFEYTYNDVGDQWYDSKKLSSITVDELKKIHEQFKSLNANIKNFQECKFNDAAEILAFIKEHFVVTSKKGGVFAKSYLTNIPFINLTVDNRICLIEKLMQPKELRQRYSINSPDFYEQDIIVEIVRNCKSTAEIYAVIKHFDDNKTLFSLLSRMYDYLYLSEGNFTQLANAITISVIDVERPGTNPAFFPIEPINKGKWLEFDNGLLTARNIEDFDTKNQKISLEVKNGAGVIVDWALGNGYGRAKLFKNGFDPLEMIIVIPKRDVTAFGTTLIKGIPYVLPAIGVYTLFKIDTKQAVVTTSAIAANTALCMIGASGLSSAGIWANIGFAVDLTLSDFTIFANMAPELYQDHPEFVQNLNYLTYAYTLGRVGYAGYAMAKVTAPARVVEAYFAEDAHALSERVVIVSEGEMRHLNASLNNIKDKNLYVAVHGEGDKFFVTINGVEEELSNTSLAIHLLEKQIPVNTDIVLISCSDLKSAHLLADFMDRPIYASHGWVDLGTNGGIAGEYDFVKVSPHVEEAEVATIRIGSGEMPTGEIVRLGKSSTFVAAEEGMEVMGTLTRLGREAYYTNPSGKTMSWGEQTPDVISKRIADAKALPINNINKGALAEAKVGEFVASKKQLLGYGLKMKNGSATIAEFDNITAHEIIEVKAAWGAMKKGQFEKFLISTEGSFCNPYNKKVILFVDEPLVNISPNEKDILDGIKALRGTNGESITVVTSLEELEKVIK
ncbi:hypothetical protein SAMN05518672_102376 [Chitinophaga sp. CF118]|uniref:fibronectin type III domain-containing protein n=1 Tax=Chitinophaga sp. CF118 TaxID=1884367 RepID=UPI0008EE7E42|nr:fibronectin type III domain-containing protein [Chitinophaga sp. CF118]SFD54633.1 hypothetical protein SAMN05518672_102376 [Chitinophaga sp. CF118]